MTTFAEWRDIGENLGRFASIREKAESPSDRILIQADKGQLKLIAGDYSKTIVVSVGATEQQGKALVPARILLQAIKTLKSKGDAELLINGDGAIIRTSFGSEIAMADMRSHFRVLRPTPYDGTGYFVSFPAGFLADAGKYLKAAIGEFAPWDQVLGRSRKGSFHLSACEDHIMATVGPLSLAQDVTLHFKADLFPALIGMEDAGGIWVPEHTGTLVHQAQIGSGKYRVAAVLNQKYPSWPALALPKYTVLVKADKKLLIDNFKALAGRHQYSRVTLVADGSSLTIKGGDAGAAKVQAEVTGKGTLPVNATFMAKVLTAVDGKSVTVEFGDAPSSVRVVGDKNNWPLLVAPMK